MYIFWIACNRNWEKNWIKCINIYYCFTKLHVIFNWIFEIGFNEIECSSINNLQKQSFCFSLPLSPTLYEKVMKTFYKNFWDTNTFIMLIEFKCTTLTHQCTVKSPHAYLRRCFSFYFISFISRFLSFALFLHASKNFHMYYKYFIWLPFFVLNIFLDSISIYCDNKK